MSTQKKITGTRAEFVPPQAKARTDHHEGEIEHQDENDDPFRHSPPTPAAIATTAPGEMSACFPENLEQSPTFSGRNRVLELLQKKIRQHQWAHVTHLQYRYMIQQSFLYTAVKQLLFFLSQRTASLI